MRADTSSLESNPEKLLVDNMLKLTERATAPGVALDLTTLDLCFKTCFLSGMSCACLV